jgi:hypothetical protein
MLFPQYSCEATQSNGCSNNFIGWRWCRLDQPEQKTDAETRLETSRNEHLAKTWISWRRQLNDATFRGIKRFCESKASDGVAIPLTKGPQTDSLFPRICGGCLAGMLFNFRCVAVADGTFQALLEMRNEWMRANLNSSRVSREAILIKTILVLYAIWKLFLCCSALLQCYDL